MKKISLLIFVITSFAISLNAQIKFIPKAGVTYSTFKRSQKTAGYDYTFPEYNLKPGFLIGLAFEIPLVGDKFSLQPEAVFQQYGTKSELNLPIDGLKFEDKITLNYISVPILAKMKFGRFFAEVGPTFDYRVGGKIEETVTYGAMTYKNDGKIKPDGETTNSSPKNIYYFNNPFNISMQMGVGVTISKIVIDVRYSLGLSNLQYANILTSENYVKNNAWQVTFGVPLIRKKSQ